ncbi:MAG: hypothetical protein WBG92_14440 [Thiohalocapsa sp.]
MTKVASQISHKYAQLHVRTLQSDLEQDHGRKVAASSIQNVAEWVGTLAAAKEEDWEYVLPRLAGGVDTVVASLDGAGGKYIGRFISHSLPVSGSRETVVWISSQFGAYGVGMPIISRGRNVAA